MQKGKGVSLCAFLALALVFGFVQAPAQDTKPKPAVPATSLPTDCVGYLHTESVASLTQNINTFVSVVMPGFDTLVSPQFHLGMAIKNPALRGIDQTRPATLVFLNPKTYPKWTAMVLSLTDPQEFLQGAGTMAAHKGEVEGIHTFSYSDFNKAAFDRATPEQRQNFEQFKVEKTFCVAFCEKRMVFAEDAATCRTVKGWVNEGLLSPSKSALVKGDLIGCAHVKALTDIYAAEMEEQIAPFLKQLEGAILAAQTAGKPQMAAMNPAAVAKLLKLEIDALLSVARQTETVEFGLDLRPEGLRGRLLVNFQPNTSAARFLAAQTAFEPDLLRFLPADAPVLAEFSLVITPELQDFYLSLIEAMYGFSEQPIDPVQKDAAMKLQKEAIGLYSGRVAIALLVPADGSGGLTILSVKKCADGPREQKLLADILDPKGPVRSVYEAGLGMKMNIKQSASEVFEGVQVNEVEIDMGEQTEEAINAMKMLYGYPMKMRHALVGDTLLFGFGKDVTNQFNKLITLVKKEGTDTLDSPAIKALTAVFPPQVNGFLAVNPTPLITSMATAVAAAQAAQPGAAAPLPPLPDAGALGVYSQVAGRTLTLEAFVPMSLILSVKDAVMTGVLGPAGGPMPRPGGARPAPAPGAPRPKGPAPAPKPVAPDQR